MTTFKQIAETATVSPATVSTVLNGRNREVWHAFAGMQTEIDRFDIGYQAAAMIPANIEKPDYPCPSRIVQPIWRPGISLPTVNSAGKP